MLYDESVQIVMHRLNPDALISGAEALSNAWQPEDVFCSRANNRMQTVRELAREPNFGRSFETLSTIKLRRYQRLAVGISYWAPIPG